MIETESPPCSLSSPPLEESKCTIYFQHQDEHCENISPTTHHKKRKLDVFYEQQENRESSDHEDRQDFDKNGVESPYKKRRTHLSETSSLPYEEVEVLASSSPPPTGDISHMDSDLSNELLEYLSTSTEAMNVNIDEPTSSEISATNRQTHSAKRFKWNTLPPHAMNLFIYWWMRISWNIKYAKKICSVDKILDYIEKECHKQGYRSITWPTLGQITSKLGNLCGKFQAYIKMVLPSLNVNFRNLTYKISVKDENQKKHYFGLYPAAVREFYFCLTIKDTHKSESWAIVDLGRFLNSIPAFDKIIGIPDCLVGIHYHHWHEHLSRTNPYEKLSEHSIESICHLENICHPLSIGFFLKSNLEKLIQTSPTELKQEYNTFLVSSYAQNHEDKANVKQDVLNSNDPTSDLTAALSAGSSSALLSLGTNESLPTPLEGGIESSSYSYHHTIEQGHLKNGDETFYQHSEILEVSSKRYSDTIAILSSDIRMIGNEIDANVLKYPKLELPYILKRELNIPQALFGNKRDCVVMDVNGETYLLDRLPNHEVSAIQTYLRYLFNEVLCVNHSKAIWLLSVIHGFENFRIEHNKNMKNTYHSDYEQTIMNDRKLASTASSFLSTWYTSKGNNLSKRQFRFSLESVCSNVAYIIKPWELLKLLQICTDNMEIIEFLFKILSGPQFKFECILELQKNSEHQLIAYVLLNIYLSIARIFYRPNDFKTKLLRSYASYLKCNDEIYHVNVNNNFIDLVTKTTVNEHMDYEIADDIYKILKRSFNF
jgi:hypothetical protein